MANPIAPTDADIAEAALRLRWNGDAEWIRRAAGQGEIGCGRVMSFAHALAKLRVAAEALESIADKNKLREWTTTQDCPQAHWVTRDGLYAVIARDTLTAIRSAEV